MTDAVATQTKVKLNTETPSVRLRIARRHATYLATPISEDIAECEDMYFNNMSHYLAVGRAAIEICVDAMTLASREEFSSILDLPCGGGRITRHLKVLFPQAQLYVGDINPAKQDYVSKAFLAQPLEVAADFSGRPSRQFDLIFVGSLLTHLNVADFTRALFWYIAATAPKGILIITLHGRRSANLMRQHAAFRDAIDAYTRTGFGFAFTQIERAAGAAIQYGGCWTKPSWVMGLVEKHPDIRILGFREAVWDDNHDVMFLQKDQI